MDWTKFNNHGESPNHAFEVMCNILFKCWLKKEYKDNISHFAFVNGSGGDGGVEAYGLLKSVILLVFNQSGFRRKWKHPNLNKLKIHFIRQLKFVLN